MVERIWTAEELALVIYFASHRVRRFALHEIFYSKLDPSNRVAQTEIDQKIDDISAKEGLQDRSMAWKHDKVARYIKSLGISEQQLLSLANVNKDDEMTITEYESFAACSPSI